MSPKPFTAAISSGFAVSKLSRVEKPASISFSIKVSPIPSISKPATNVGKETVLWARRDLITFFAPKDSLSFAILSSFKK